MEVITKMPVQELHYVGLINCLIIPSRVYKSANELRLRLYAPRFLVYHSQNEDTGKRISERSGSEELVLDTELKEVDVGQDKATNLILKFLLGWYIRNPIHPVFFHSHLSST